MHVKFSIFVIITSASAGVLAMASAFLGGQHRQHHETPAALNEIASRSRAANVLIVAGGHAPESTQVSLEADASLASEVLGQDALLLFAGGPGSQAVQVERTEPPAQRLETALGAIFSPRGGRDANYRATSLQPDAPATRQAVLSQLQRLLTQNNAPPLTLYFAGHGDQGEAPADNAMMLWGGGTVTPRDLDETMQKAPAKRPLRIISSACFSGGFAEIVFPGVDAARASEFSQPPNCGLFSSTWDREATGCDPNPDRSRHQGYGVYFLNALRRRHPDDSPLADAQIDLDHDGRVNFLEAHAFVSVSADTIDVPTTTAQRWLESLASPRATLPASTQPQVPSELIELAHTIATLAARLNVAPTLNDTQAALQKVTQEKEELDAAAQKLAEHQDQAYLQLASELLHRWPVIDDPWHPDFAATLADNRARIDAFINTHPATETLVSLGEELADLSQAAEHLQIAQAQLLRLHNAVVYAARAQHVKASHRQGWQRLLRIVDCERGREESLKNTPR